MRGWAPGGRGPLAPLQEMLRQSYADAQRAVGEAIVERSRVGVPLDDDTDWRAEGGRIGELTLAAKEQDTARYRKALEEALLATRGLLRPLPAYRPDRSLDGIQVRYRTVPRRVWWATVGRTQELMARTALLDKRGLETEGATRGQLLADIEEAKMELVKHALVELKGVEGVDFFIAADEVQSEAALGVLTESGLLDAVYEAARDFQRLDPEGRARFGLELQPTSQTSTAIGAQSAHASSRAAMEAPLHASIEAPPSKRTSVLDVDSFVILGQPMPSPSGEQPMAARSASTAPS